MLDIGWTEIVVVAVVALLVLGPRELPRALKTFGAVMSKARSMAREFQSGVDEMIRETELDDLRKDLQQATRLDFDEGTSGGNKIDPTSGQATIEHVDSAALPDPPAMPASAAAGEAAASVPDSTSDSTSASASATTSVSAPASGTPTSAAAGTSASGVQQVPASAYVRATPPSAGSAGEPPPFGSSRFDNDYQGAQEAQASGDFVPPEADPDAAGKTEHRTGAPSGASQSAAPDVAPAGGGAVPVGQDAGGEDPDMSRTPARAAE